VGGPAVSESAGSGDLKAAVLPAEADPSVTTAAIALSPSTC